MKAYWIHYFFFSIHLSQEYFKFRKEINTMEGTAFISGFAILIVLWFIYSVMSGTWNPWKLVEGQDGKPSTSKLQWFLWTLVVVFAYTAIYAANVWNGKFDVISDIPQNLLIVMGLSLTTMAAAKGITVSYAEQNKLPKDKDTSKKANVGAIEFASDFQPSQDPANGGF